MALRNLAGKLRIRAFQQASPPRVSPAAGSRRIPSRSYHYHIAKLTEAERVEASKQLDKLDEEIQSKLVQEVDAYLQSSPLSNDKGEFNRLLTFFGVPRGEPRENLILYSSLALSFIASWALGEWEANNCLQYLYGKQRIQEEEEANQAA